MWLTFQLMVEDVIDILIDDVIDILIDDWGCDWL